MNIFLLGTGILMLVVVIQMVRLVKRRRMYEDIKYSEKFFDKDKLKVLYQDSDWMYELLWRQGDIVIRGKPDYVLQDKLTGEIRVMDLKSGKKHKYLSEGYKFQLAAYMLLVEEKYKSAPTEGVIHYLEDNSEHVIKNSPALMKELMARIMEMDRIKRQIRQTGEIPHISHQDPKRCKWCEYGKNGKCRESLSGS